MKQVLVSPNESYRIVQINNVRFDVAKPLFWVAGPPEIDYDWRYNLTTGTFSPPLPVTPPSTPDVMIVTRRQAKQELIYRGLYNNVLTILAAIEDPDEKLMAEVWWNDADTFQKDHPTLLGFAAALGLSSEQLTEIFNAAALRT